MQKLITNTEKFCSLILKNYQQTIPFSLKSQLIAFRSYLQTFDQGRQAFLQNYIQRLEKEYQQHSNPQSFSNHCQHHSTHSTNNLKMKTEVYHQHESNHQFNENNRISDYAFSSVDAISKHSNKHQNSHSHHSSIDQSINQTLLMSNDQNINIGNLHPQGILFKRKSENDNCFLGASLGHNYKKHKRNSSNRSGDTAIAASVGSNNIKSLKIILKPKTNTNFVNKNPLLKQINASDKSLNKFEQGKSCQKKQAGKSEKGQKSQLIISSRQSSESRKESAKFFQTVNLPRPLKSIKSINRNRNIFSNKEILSNMKENIESLLKLYDQNYDMVNFHEQKYDCFMTQRVEQSYQNYGRDDQSKGIQTIR